MSDTRASSNLQEYSVSELSQALKRTVEDAYSYVRLRGEISGFKRAASGHMYMALKDADAVMDGVCWRGQAGRLSVNPEDGLEVVVTGRLTTYPGRSKYQIVIESMEMAGEGALLKLLEERRRKLAAEGLFDEGRKKPLPFLPDVIGVVTSPTGAVIRDIMHRLQDRFPRHVLLWPVLVQGEGAAEQVAAAIRGFNQLGTDLTLPRPDLLIVARGGGSLEDLWAFNEEIVVRAAAESDIPLISAVGHETDTTLIDFASDRRAPTPTAAAEIAVPVRAELQATVMDLDRRAFTAASRMVEEGRRLVESLARGLPRPDSLLQVAAQRLDDMGERQENGMRGLLQKRGQDVALLAGRLRSPVQVLDAKADQLRGLSGRLDQAMAQQQRQARAKYDGAGLEQRLQRAGARLLDTQARHLEQLSIRLENLSYRNVLKRGYALVRDSEGHAVSAAAATEVGQAVSIELQDGTVDAVVGFDSFSSAYSAATQPKPRRAKAKVKAPEAVKPDDKAEADKTAGKKDDRQGTLL